MIGRWQSDLLASGAGPVAVRRALELLGSIMQRAAESGRIQTNPVRIVRKAKLPKRPKVKPLAPVTIERMRAPSNPRDATLISVLAYAGLRPGEALGLRWGDLGERTILVQRSISLGVAKATKTNTSRSVRLLQPLARGLAEWRMRRGRPDDRKLIFPGHDGEPWSGPAYQSWRRRAFRRALNAADAEHARPYDLRHSFASLLIAERRNVIEVARQLGHSATMTLNVYGHENSELGEVPRQSAEDAILDARAAVAHQLRRADGGEVAR
ncbi:MAG: site-specific integrase [Solirubrobacterales bacterium]|nr:site-specific integrase [Solirubrobacterales bacterium]